MARLAKWTQTVRLGCILGLLAVAYLAFDHTKSELFAAESSRQEHDINALFQSVKAGASVAHRTKSMQRAALSSNALDKQAILQVWVEAAGQKGVPQALELLSTTGKITRRSPSYLAADLLTAAQTDDIPRVVRAFDRMASLSPAMRPSLMELAVPLLDDPEGARLLAQLHSRPWFIQFIASAIRQPEGTEQIAKLLKSIQVSDPALRLKYFSLVTKQFLQRNQIAEAQKFAKVFGNVKDEDFNNLDFQQPTSSLASNLLAWQFTNPDAQPMIERNGELRFTINSNLSNQPLAEKMLLLKPGHHRIETKLKFSGATGDVLIGWKVYCGPLMLSKTFMSTQTINSNQNFLVFEFQTTKPCQGYRLSLNLNKTNDNFDFFDVIVSQPLYTFNY